MSLLRLIEPLPLQRIQSLLNDDNVKVKPIRVQYEDYVVNNEAVAELHPLHFVWHYGEESKEPLLFALDTWATKASLAAPGSYLKVGTEENHRIVGFSLPLVPQDDKYVYLGFKQGIGEGGKNRWFGRGDKKEDLRTDDTMRKLTEKLRQTWHTFFPAALPEQHPKLSGDWLLLARLPLVDLDPSASKGRRTTLKTLILKTIVQAFIIAEKLRDESFVGIETSATFDATDSSFSSKMTTPLNQILYGPPGTGKTYHTAVRAVGIIEGMADEEIVDTYSRAEIRSKFEEYRTAGQVAFVTFHQAFGYEDFVEGIKPNLTADDEVKYRVETGLFRRMADAANEAWQRVNTPATPQTEPAVLAFSLVYGGYLADLQARLAVSPDHTVTIPTAGNYPAVISAAADSGIISIRHGNAPLQYNVRAAWTQAVYQRYAQASDIVPMNKKMLEIGGPNATLQWAIFNDLQKYEVAHLNELQAQTAVEEGPALPAPTTIDRYVLIIDEINRGNVANIFGELITLLEDDKRAGRPEALTVQLPYSKEDFTVPENLYLLGTMNTADRSVEALDTALRRRFSFTEMRPDAQVIRANVGNNGVIGTGAEAVDVARLLEVLNSRLEQLLDHDHCLGHALLLRLSDLDGLRAAFARNILPLLQEYFFGDWGKIGLVLGPRFVEVVKANAPGRFALASLPGYDGGTVRDKPLYRLAKPETWDAAAFQSIYPAAPATAV